MLHGIYNSKWKTPTYSCPPPFGCGGGCNHTHVSTADSLIRYVATPVFSKMNNTGKCLGVLLAGDITSGIVTVVVKLPVL